MMQSQWGHAETAHNWWVAWFKPGPEEGWYGKAVATEISYQLFEDHTIEWMQEHLQEESQQRALKGLTHHYVFDRMEGKPNNYVHRALGWTRPSPEEFSL